MTTQDNFKKIQTAGEKLMANFDYKLQEKYYSNLWMYFSGDKNCEWDTTKGLLICGDLGTGKTLSLRVMQELFRTFGIVNSRHLNREYVLQGIIVAEKYGRLSFKTNSQGHIDKSKPITWCFDDFGNENINTKNFGNQVNIMEEILSDRYDMYICYKMKTIITTNLNPDMIEQYYGKRVRDRLKEMVNHVTLTGKSLRK